ncbi:hypothetical protein [Streptomyces coerulescens]|uniref:Lipoprotein n=1 Tax=Streptomyces coerulescens TaxID=29304 RepID=A0ABW0CGW3_STRCD
MRRARTHRRAGAVAVAAALPLLGGCGIQDTDVIEAGGPASFQAFFNRDFDMLLFFRAPDGRLTPVIRTTEPLIESSTEVGAGYVESGSGAQNADEPTGPVPTAKVVSALLDGPRADDRAAGLTTALPTVRSGGTIEVERSSDGRVTTRLPLALKGLDSTALRQLTCTIAYSQDPDGKVTVKLTGQDGTTRTDTCELTPADPGNEPAATQTSATRQGLGRRPCRRRLPRSRP